MVRIGSVKYAKDAHCAHRVVWEKTGDFEDFQGFRGGNFLKLQGVWIALVDHGTVSECVGIT